MSSLNLLPDEIKSDISLSKKNAKQKQVLFRLVALLFIILAFFGVLFFFLFTSRADFIEQKEIAQQQIKRQDASFEKAKDLYERLNLINKLEKGQTDWLAILNEIANSTPANVQIDSFSLFSVAGYPKIKLTGVAANDKEVVAFKENLGKTALFEYVDIESISAGSDPSGKNRETRSFTISFILKVKK